MKFRSHRATLKESMTTCVVLQPTKAALVKHLNSQDGHLPLVKEEDVEANLYLSTPDPRIGWPQTYVVTLKGEGVGFLDGPLLK